MLRNGHLKYVRVIAVFLSCIFWQINSSFVSVELSHVEFFEVNAIDDHEFVQSPYKELEDELENDESVLKFREQPESKKQADVSVNNTTEAQTQNRVIVIDKASIIPNNTDGAHVDKRENDIQAKKRNFVFVSTSKSTSVDYEDQLKRLVLSKDQVSKNDEAFETQIIKPSLLTGHNEIRKIKRFQSRILLALSEHKDRKRRQVGLDANLGWQMHYTTLNPKGNGTKSDDSFQVITDDDRRKAEQEKVKSILIYVGSTLLSVLMFSFIAYCFVKNPKTCIVSFGTGCPCCLICLPICYKILDKIDPRKILKGQVNKYLPGVIIHEDGTIEAYDISPEEIDIVCDIIDELH